MQYILNKIYSDYTNVHQICREVLDVSEAQQIEAVGDSHLSDNWGLSMIRAVKPHNN